MAKIKLTASPTFKCKVDIPVPGEKSVPVEFTFKGRTKAQFKELIDGLRKTSEDAESEGDDAKLILEIATGWELVDIFDYDNITTFTQNYIAGAGAILNKYLSELTQARLGN